MRQTPRSLLAARDVSRARGIGTLIGNGWLRESPRGAFPGLRWDVRVGKSALRKCMFMAVPHQLRGLLPPGERGAPGAPSAGPAQPVNRPAPAEDMVPHRRDARKDVREFPAFVPGRALDPRAVAQQARAVQVEDARRAAMAAAMGHTPAAWWEDPVALGSLLILVPPVGLAAVWSSKRYSSDARWALTVMTALTMCLMTAVIIATLVAG